jgi:hypothetical protein
MCSFIVYEVHNRIFEVAVELTMVPGMVIWLIHWDLSFIRFFISASGSVAPSDLVRWRYEPQPTAPVSQTLV